MRLIFFSIIFLFYFNFLNANNNIVYINIQYIIDNSDLGLFYKDKVNKIREQIKLEMKEKEEELKNKETNIKNKKNLLKEEELNKFILDFDKSLKNYNSFRNDKSKLVINEKKKYSAKILETLNPILTSFVENNNISLVLEKKNIIVGAKALDITENIMILLNKETENNNLLNEN